MVAAGDDWCGNRSYGADWPRSFRWEGLGFDNFAGHGFFVGPTIYANLSERSWILLAWNVQIAGRSADDPASLDLKNFERHQATLKFGFTF
jgi:hypothetical protein